MRDSEPSIGSNPLRLACQSIRRSINPSSTSAPTSSRNPMKQSVITHTKRAMKQLQDEVDKRLSSHEESFALQYVLARRGGEEGEGERSRRKTWLGNALRFVREADALAYGLSKWEEVRVVRTADRPNARWSRSAGLVLFEPDPGPDDPAK